MAGIKIPVQPEYVILLHLDGEPSFIARRSFTSQTDAVAHLDAELKKNHNISSGRIYRLRNNELFKVIDMKRRVVNQVVYHDAPEIS